MKAKLLRGLRFAVCAALVAASSWGQGPRQKRSAPSDIQDEEFRAYLAETDEQDAVARLEELELRIKGLQRRTIARGQAYVRLLKLGLLPLSAGHEAMLSHAGRVERLRRALAADIALQRDLEAQSEGLKQGLADSRRRKTELQGRLVNYQRSREAILAAREREVAYRRAFDHDWDPSEHTAVYNPPQLKTRQGTSFLNLKGHLPFPVEGRAEISNIQLEDSMGQGVLLKVREKATVRAVHPGRVVLSGDYGDLGQAVVIEHGDGYSTLSAHLGMLNVEAGDSVEAGQAIARLAPESDGQLYFEVRYRGGAVPPVDWFGL